MADEIGAAIIQAIPLGVAAWAGWRGLNTWRTQIREGRQVKHAERALAEAVVMFGAIRTARRPWFQHSGEGLRMTRDRLNHAWDAQKRFQRHYTRAGLYRERPSFDVAADVEKCIAGLHQHVEHGDDQQDQRERAEPVATSLWRSVELQRPQPAQRVPDVGGRGGRIGVQDAIGQPAQEHGHAVGLRAQRGQLQRPCRAEVPVMPLDSTTFRRPTVTVLPPQGPLEPPERSLRAPIDDLDHDVDALRSAAPRCRPCGTDASARGRIRRPSAPHLT
jgi:hypothetical protein